MKIYIKFGTQFLIIFISFLTISKQVYSQCAPCLTNTLDLGTGYNHEIGSFYPQYAVDQYWRVADGPTSHGPYPRCAISQGTPNGAIAGALTSTRISLTASGLADGNKPGNSTNCSFNDAPYLFRRDFCVNTGPGNPTVLANLNLTNFYVDVKIREIRLSGPGLNTVISSFCWNQAVQTLPPVAVNLSTGIYTLEFQVLNDWGNGCNFPPCWNVQTHMNMQLEGSITSTIPIFTDNKHFGKNTNLCAPSYTLIEEPIVSGFCKSISDTSLSSTITITNFNPNLNYTLSPGNIPITASTFQGIVNNSYTITASDAYGCTVSTNFNVVFGPDFNLSPSHQCVTPGGTGGVAVVPSPTLSMPYTQQLNNGPFTTPLSYNLTQGIYTISVKDSNNCITSKTATIGNLMVAMYNILPSPPCINPGDTVYIGCFSNPQGAADTILLNNNVVGVNVNSVWVPVTTAGTYTITVKDTLGCWDDTTVTVYNFPVVTASLTSNVGCVYPNQNATITANATGTGMPYLYQLNGPNGPTSWQSSPVFVVNSPGSYILDIIGVGNCEVENVANIYIGDCSKCNNGVFNIAPSNAIWYTTGNSSFTFPTNVTPTTPIVIDGIITVDANLDIFNNPNVLFTDLSYLKLDSANITLNIQNSRLQGCYWWKGIKAHYADNQVIANNSTFKHMYNYAAGVSLIDLGGISLRNGALGAITNNIFDINANCLVFKNTPSIYNGIIRNNEFGLMSNPFYGVAAIVAEDNRNLTIGGLGNMNEGNSFNKFTFGVLMQSKFSDTSTLNFTMQYYLYNNRFDHCGPLSGINTTIPEYELLNFIEGAIVATQKNAPGIRTFLTVDNTQMDNSVVIRNCNHGIHTLNTFLVAKNCVIENCLRGITAKSLRMRNYGIGNNYMTNVHYGISISNAINYMNIQNNAITTRNIPISYTVGASTFKISPIGIDLNFSPYSSPSGFRLVQQNTIHLGYKTGIGIRNANGKQGETLMDNNIHFYDGSIGSVADHVTKSYFGIHNTNSKFVSLKSNYVLGDGLSNQTSFTARNSIGIYMGQCPNNTLECNKIKYSRYGIYAWGDNSTGSNSIRYNRTNANAYPWYFLDGGSPSPGTFGNVGGLNQDNGNTFISSINWMGVGGLNTGMFKVFRNSSVQTNHKIFTNTSKIVLSESSAPSLLNRYQIQNNSVNYVEPCLSTPTYDLAISSGLSVDSSYIDNMEDIAQDSVTYLNYAAAAKWLSMLNLYKELDQDSLLRNSDPILNDFYVDQLTENTALIHEADLAIARLMDSSCTENNFTSLYNDAVAKNNLIISGEEWELNEYHINDAYLRMLVNHTDSIDVNTRDLILQLAHSCPYVAGNAVYKARALAAQWDAGAFYDDRLLCMPGSYKNIDPNSIDIDEFYESQIGNIASNEVNTFNNSQNKINLPHEEVLVFPNPASDELNVKHSYSQEGIFYLYNGTGQELLQQPLLMGSPTTIPIKGIETGLYLYKCIFKHGEQQMGKIKIIKHE